MCVCAQCVCDVCQCHCDCDCPRFIVTVPQWSQLTSTDSMTDSCHRQSVNRESVCGGGGGYSLYYRATSTTCLQANVWDRYLLFLLCMSLNQMINETTWLCDGIQRSNAS